MEYILSVLTTAALFLLLVLLLAVKPSLSKRITFYALAIAGISGMVIYGYGYMVVTGNFALAVLKALLAVCGSFIGRNEFSALSSVPLMQTTGMQIYCTFTQICALYATASAVITSIGKEALKKLRLLLTRRDNVALIYGVHGAALEFGQELLSLKRSRVVFVADGAAASGAVSAMGAVLLADSHAANADSKMLRQIGLRKKSQSLTLYALDPDPNANIRYAKCLLNTLEQLQMPQEQLRLVIIGQEEAAIKALQCDAQRYGYGFVHAIHEPQLAARMLTRKHPPCDTLRFGDDGKAQEDFEALLIGFGKVGQEVLKALVMNGQFEGSHFRAAVFAPDRNNTDGSFFNQCPMMDGYDITFYEHDARSRAMYAYLKERGARLKYAVICTGSPKLNREIAEELTAYFQRRGLEVPLFQCSRQGVSAYAADGTVAASYKLYCAELLCGDRIDHMAMILNHRYHRSTERTALEHWMECDYFSRQSCRASADFLPAFLRAAGRTGEQAAAGDWALTDRQKENLSRTEHLRWCAFHACMGFRPMEQKEFDERAQLYRRQLLQDGKATLRIGKNMATRTHACLVSWEELETLSRREAAVTGKYVDYQAMDTENVLAVPQLLVAEKEKAG